MLVRSGVAALLVAGAVGWAAQETKAPGASQEFALAFTAAEGIVFPFETNAEAGGGGCAPPVFHHLKAGKESTLCLALAGQEIAVETEANKIRVDTDGDGKPDEVIKGEQGTVTVALNNGGQKTSYAVRFYGNGSGVWTFERWGYTSGKVQGTSVVLIDENANGRYDDIGKDRMVVGNGTQAHPLSPVANLGGKLFELTFDPAGTRVHTRPYTGAVGTLDLSSKFRSKAKLASAVVKNNLNYFEVAGGEVTLPIGEYRLFSGIVSAAPQLAHLKQGAMKPFTVDVDKVTTVEWGMPVAIEFEHAFRDEHVTIQPSQIHVRGEKGEEYFAFKPMAFTPTVVVRDMRSEAVVQKGTMVLG